jgi:hypothetical protein
MAKTKKIKDLAAAAAPVKTLTLEEIMILETELTGVSDPQTGEVTYRGIMGQKLPLTTKFKLHKLQTEAAQIKKDTQELRKQLITSLANGKDEQGEPVVERFVKDKDGKIIVPNQLTPEFVEVNKQWEELLKQVTPITIPELKVSQFESIETDEIYMVFMSILEE